MGWKLDVEGAVLYEEDVTAAQATVINGMLETSGWESVNPMSSPEALAAWAAVAVAINTGQDLQLSVMYVQSKPLVELIGCFTAEAVKPEPPVVEASPPAAPWPTSVPVS